MSKAKQPQISLTGNDVIPPTNIKRQRTLVLCFDGTGDQFDNDVCYVHPLMSRLELNAAI